MMYGAGIDNVKELFPDAAQIHNEINPSFGELHHPEPIAENLFSLKQHIKEGKFDVGFAFDGDADRLGAMDHTGEFVDSHKIFMILLKYIFEYKKKRGTVVAGNLAVLRARTKWSLPTNGYITSITLSNVFFIMKLHLAIKIV